MNISKVKTILIYRLDKIGDLLVSIPAFYTLRKMYPNAKIITLLTRYNAPVFDKRLVDKMIIIDDYKEESLIELLNSFEVDILIAMDNSATTKRICTKTHAPIKIGYLKKETDRFIYNNGFYKKKIDLNNNSISYHNTFVALALIKHLNPSLFKKNFSLSFPLNIENSYLHNADNYFIKNKIVGQCIFISPFSGGTGKTLQISDWMNLLVSIKKEQPNVNIIIGCYEKVVFDQSKSKKIDKATMVYNNEVIHAKTLVGLLPFKVYLFKNKGHIFNTAAIIKKCDLFIGPSSANYHLAWILGKKTLGIFSMDIDDSTNNWGSLYKNNSFFFKLENKTKIVKNEFKYKFIYYILRLKISLSRKYYKYFFKSKSSYIFFKKLNIRQEKELYEMVKLALK